MGRFLSATRAFFALALPYFRSQERWRALALLLGVIAAEIALVYLAVVTNQWHRRFFNALEARDWITVRFELLIFGLIVAGNVLTGMGMFWVGQHFQIRWRQWMTEQFVAKWMAEGRHYRVRFVDPNVDNIHLRIANDIGVFIQRTYEIGSGLVGVIVMFTSFAVILIDLSATTPMPLFGLDLAFPGYLLVTALVYASLGTLFAHLVGRRLIHLNFQQQRREADLRYATARVTDHSEQVALLKAEAVERNEIGRRFGALVGNWVILAAVQSRLTGFIYGYGQISTVFPTLVVTPAYLLGAIPLGILMQTASAFQRVENSVAFIINYYGKIAEWKAAMDRVWQMDAALRRVDRADLAHAALVVKQESRPDMAVHGVVLRRDDGRAIVSVPDLTLATGDRLLVNGASGSGKSTLFRALSGNWPFGEGQIRIPQGARLLILPSRPYFPLGTLRQAIALPTPAEEIADQDIRSAMEAVGLGHLIPRLDEIAEWDTALSAGEQHRVGFARALIHRPSILLLDDADAMVEGGRARELYRLLIERLPDTIIISASRTEALSDLHRRTIELGPARAETRSQEVLTAAI
ncbi:MAG TPA: ABC transporter ATP-binding protein/permease [Xanthobacteraceae bacterium]|nr:ABC transporter ATP-binding protein/permease [Xanthobacteraceae bacterium]